MTSHGSSCRRDAEGADDPVGARARGTAVWRVGAAPVRCAAVWLALAGALGACQGRVGSSRGAVSAAEDAGDASELVEPPEADASEQPPDASEPTPDAGEPTPDAGETDAKAPSCDASAAWVHPNSLLNAAEIEAIATKVKAGAEPWASAYQRALAEADAAKKLAPRSVRTEGNSGADYFTGHPYCGWGANSPCGQDCCDGINNPNTDRGDYEAAIEISHAVRSLGLGYAFTKDASYAKQAIALMRHWAVDDATAMTPKFTNTSSEIELAITMPAMFYGADLIWSYPDWPDRAAFADWARALAKDVRGKGAGTAVQNFGDWRLMLLGTAALVSEDAELLQYVFDHYKKLVPNQINEKGELVLELDRTKALFYSLYAVDAISQVCELGRHHGVDLYHFAADNGSGSLEKALDWLAPYVLNPASWPHLQISPLTANDSIATFEIGYFAWGKADYLSVLERFGRPIYEIRTAGPLTLTHGRGAFPWKLGGPSVGARVCAEP